MQIRFDLAPCHPLAPIAAAIAFAWPSSAGAAEWRLVPAVDVRETYTDNLRLAPAGSEHSDFVTEITPRLSINATGARMKLAADYAMRNYFYARDDGASNTHHQLQAAANAELSEDIFFLDAKASAGRQAISAFGPQLAGSGHPVDNQADVRTWDFSPYLRHRFGRSATAELRYGHDVVSTDTGGLLDSRSDRVHLAVDSGPEFRTLQWGIAYDSRKIIYDAAENVETRVYTGSLRYRVLPRVAFTATAGYEDNSYASIGRKPEGKFWSMGGAWLPSERTSFEVSAGRRFFGKTLSLNAQHRTRATVWSAGYREEITTTRAQFLMPSAQDTAAFLNGLWMSSVPDQVQREDMVRSFIRDAGLPATLTIPVNGFTNRVFLQKSAHGSVALRGTRNTVTVSVYRIEREPQSAAGADGFFAASALSGEATRQDGASAVWNWRLSPRTSLTAAAGYGRVRSDLNGRRDRNVTGRIGLSRQLQQRLAGGIELRRLEQRSSQPGEEFSENAISAFLQMSF